MVGPVQRMLMHYIWSFNHPSPWWLGQKARKNLQNQGSFNHPIPCGLGRVFIFLIVLVSFQSSQPIWVESCISFISRTNSVLQSSQPAGIGSFSKNTSKSHSMFQSSQPAGVGSYISRCKITLTVVSIIPTRGGWVVFYNLSLSVNIEFQSSKPAGVGRWYYILCTAVYLRFNHPNPRGLGQQ